MLTSSKPYEIMRDSGFVCLASQRTLRDYTHWVKLKPGFNAEVFNHFKVEAKVDQMAEWERFVYSPSLCTIIIIIIFHIDL